MKTLSMLELRTQTQAVLKALHQGESFLLTYRGKKLARLTPEKETAPIAENDPLYLLSAKAAAGAGTLDDREIDRAVYELR